MRSSLLATSPLSCPHPLISLALLPRPHQEFGINLSIPWSAGSKEDPNYHVHTGSVYTTTRGLEDKARAELGYEGPAMGQDVGPNAIITTTAGMDRDDLLEKFGKNAAVGQDESRPWEMVGGVGFEKKSKVREPLYVPPAQRLDLNASSPNAPEVAEEFNDLAVKAFKAKTWQLCYDYASEVTTLCFSNFPRPWPRGSSLWRWPWPWPWLWPLPWMFRWARTRAQALAASRCNCV